ncbi:MAG: hypothetical protein TYPL_3660 [Candidatus Tyloplasma litorale]|nr:MAG: hypothetical protein TYPL_3660 [Mycoplasmatales bacterium]
MNFFIIFLIELLLLTPLIVVYAKQEKMGRVRHINVTFSAPDGTKKSMPLKIGFSWTVFFFKGWALLFRGQFIEFLIVFFGTTMLSAFGLYCLNGFNPIPDDATFSIIVDDATVGGWIGFISMLLISTAISYYYILFANKLRLRSYYKRGFSFDDPRNGNIEDLYKYINVQPKTVNEEELAPNVKQGSTHQYVVPEKHEQKVEENNHDYSNLTPQDLKLLLKSEGIPYSPESNKNELLELVEEFIVKPAKEKEKIERERIKKERAEAAIKEQAEIEKNNKYPNSKYSKLTIIELVKELDSKKIKYENNMNKEQLIELLEKYYQEKANKKTKSTKK